MRRFETGGVVALVTNHLPTGHGAVGQLVSVDMRPDELVVPTKFPIARRMMSTLPFKTGPKRGYDQSANPSLPERRSPGKPELRCRARASPHGNAMPDFDRSSPWGPTIRRASDGQSAQARYSQETPRTRAESSPQVAALDRAPTARVGCRRPVGGDAWADRPGSHPSRREADHGHGPSPQSSGHGS